jgi:methyltransferase (TIGR00027 family)
MPPKAARTAYGPMAQIAIDQRWPEEQRIVSDELAFRLLPAYLQTMVRLLRWPPVYFPFMGLADRISPGVRGGLLCRKRYIDDKLREALAAGIDTVVILGAGWDDRAYRPPVSGAARVFEADLPDIAAAKAEAVTRLFGRVPEHVRLVPVDFEKQDLRAELQKAGYSEEKRAFFIWEGMTQYLDGESVRRTLAFLSTAAAGSRLVFTYILREFIDGSDIHGMRIMHRATRGREAFWKFGLAPEETAPLLAEFSWREREQVGTEEYMERYVSPARRSFPVMPIERAVEGVKG